MQGREGMPRGLWEMMGVSRCLDPREMTCVPGEARLVGLAEVDWMGDWRGWTRGNAITPDFGSGGKRNERGWLRWRWVIDARTWLLGMYSVPHPTSGG